jgi:predicted  nucleic acid-binding Zn-ribbon protein
MASLSAQMDVIVEKTKNLIQLCEALQEENDLLKLELQSVQVAFQTSTDKVSQLEEKLKAVAVAKSLEDANIDKEAINEKILDTKQKINDFVREIDRCINLLK